ncbi:polysaccharide deacetylase family protein [Flavobacterium aurantiibacter]|uniref:Polysaccharide (De)acetylase n=1 Tax=Flavobacterium aurantiibacter TaxID=2023067 RepID=A0A255ZRE6_9FLAO|nr:polysaccharide (de)acetylase [Flavobacterium aurantiibacter]OYQ43952.1 polysaccharide (de)acetylase [Flavobacterium aurantiibacter]
MIKKFSKIIANLPGFLTTKKIVVLESDDWGSIRMPSSKSYDNLIAAGFDLGSGAGGRYNKYDTLASKQDLEALFECLSSVKNSRGESAKLTAVSLVANPDFVKIRESGFSNYYYEPFTTTLKRYGKEDAFPLWKQGFDAGVFVPEFHGREHLNISSWMRALQDHDHEARTAFDEGLWGYNITSNKRIKTFQAAFDLEFNSDLATQMEVIEDGLKLFEEIHGRKARFFVPPNGPINDSLLTVAAKCGIEYVSTSKVHAEVLGEGRIKKHYRYIGMRNSSKQTYLTRNAFFEPTAAKGDEIGKCLDDINLAFTCFKPAIISTHRVNFIGGLNEENRNNSLDSLKQLLRRIVKKWPDVEFMTSTELGDYIQSKKS